MALDIPLWVGLLMAFGDMAVATYIGMRYGPERAKRLTVSEFKEPGTAAQVRQALGLASATDLAQWQLSLEGRIKEDMRTSLTEALKQLPRPEVSANITLPVSMQDAVQRDIRAVARQVMKEVVSTDIQAMLDTAVQKALQRRSPEDELNDIDNQVQLDALYGVVSDAAARLRIPQAAVDIAYQKGLPVMRLLGQRLDQRIKEELGA